MRIFAPLCAAYLLVGCGPDQAARQPAQAVHAAPDPGTSTEGPQEFLLAASAKDFHDHQPPYPAQFREVHFGHVARPDGTKMYLLSGQFQPAKGEWTPFATIQTSGYEQLLGAQAKSYCEQPSIVWEDQKDLSATLKGRLDSLR